MRHFDMTPKKYNINITAEYKTDKGWENINTPCPPYTQTVIPEGKNFQIPKNLAKQTTAYFSTHVGNSMFDITPEMAKHLIDTNKTTELGQDTIADPEIVHLTTISLNTLKQLVNTDDIKWKATVTYLETFNNERETRIIAWWTNP